MSDETESEVEPGLHTNEEKMALWQMNKIAIEYKRGILKRGEATQRFSYWAELPPSISWLLLGPMAASSHQELMKAFPKWITKDKEPTFDHDPAKATRAANLARRKESGLDSVGRPSSALGGRRRKDSGSADRTSG